MSRLLEPYGYAVTGTTVRGAAAASAAASRLGFPVALKVADPDIVHKTERGLVHIGLTSSDEVEVASRAFAVEVSDEDVDLLVQPMLDGVEIAVGIVRDPGLGPLVMVAPGGTATELWEDSHLLLAPLSGADVRRALRSSGPGRCSRASADRPRSTWRPWWSWSWPWDPWQPRYPRWPSFDLNPVLVRANGVALVDVKIRLAPADANDDVPRSLRSP